MPQRHAYVKCPGCRRIIDQELLEQALDVCPRCGHHLRLSARKRLEATVDKDSFEAWSLDIPTPDPLAFPGYQEKLAAAKGGSSEREGVICGSARIGGEACASSSWTASS